MLMLETKIFLSSWYFKPNSRLRLCSKICFDCDCRFRHFILFHSDPRLRIDGFSLSETFWRLTPTLNPLLLSVVFSLESALCFISYFLKLFNPVTSHINCKNFISIASGLCPSFKLIPHVFVQASPMSPDIEHRLYCVKGFRSQIHCHSQIFLQASISTGIIFQALEITQQRRNNFFPTIWILLSQLINFGATGSYVL